MQLPQVVTREQWTVARAALLEQEKQLTRRRDEVTAQRRALPMVEVTTPYVFHSSAGPLSLLDLFEGRRQLVVYHFMWLEDRDEGCSSCSLLADNIGELSHLHFCDTTLALVSRAPIDRIGRFRRRMGWQAPWYSSLGSDFNVDFHASAPDATGRMHDLHGASVFLRDGDTVFHTYSTGGRGVDLLLGTYNYLDLTTLGRQRYVNEFPHHDRAAVGCH